MSTHVSMHPIAQKPRAFAVDTQRLLPVVRRIAMRLARRLPRHIDAAELVSVGWVGLMEVASRAPASIPPEEFEAYASQRIQGAMLDYLRSLHPNARERRNSSRRIARATSRASQQHGRAPSEAEVAAEMGITVEVFRTHVASGCARTFEMVDCDEIQLTSDASAPDETVIHQAMTNSLASEIEALPARLQQILSLYYREDCTLREVGVVLGVSESRVSQLLAEATKRLRASVSN